MSHQLISDAEKPSRLPIPLRSIAALALPKP